tara:strand:- start:31 stop:633 length:603 start_codon:yes stop_codon:yes gene_type:complete
MSNQAHCPLEFFDAIYCITLNPTSHRAQIARGQFNELGLCVEFIIGESTQPYQHGCCKAHIKCIELAKKKKCKNVLIFEDDVAFINYNAEILKESLESLPSSWELFFLGGLLRVSAPVEKISQNLIKAKVSENHAYAVNSSVFDEILSWKLNPDEQLVKRYKIFRECYSLFPLLTFQLDPQKAFRTMNALHSNFRLQYLT